MMTTITISTIAISVSGMILSMSVLSSILLIGFLAGREILQSGEMDDVGSLLGGRHRDVAWHNIEVQSSILQHLHHHHHPDPVPVIQLREIELKT